PSTRSRASSARSHPTESRGMYAIIAGAGKVGRNLARELISKDHEVTLIESFRPRYLTLEEDFEHAVQYGDATELWVLERAGIQRADLVIAVTGDDEDNILVCQVAKEKYLCDRPDPAPDRARGAPLRPRAPARPRRGASGDHRARGDPRRAHARDEGLRHRAPRGQPDHLGAARRHRLRAKSRHRHRSRRRGAAGARPGPRGGHHRLLRAQRAPGEHLDELCHGGYAV